MKLPDQPNMVAINLKLSINTELLYFSETHESSVYVSELCVWSAELTSSCGALFSNFHFHQELS